jgi:hypothetical protein
VTPFPQVVRSDDGAQAVMVRIEVGSGCENQTQPRERTMTIDRMNLQALIEKAPDADFLREMIESSRSG